MNSRIINGISGNHSKDLDSPLSVDCSFPVKTILFSVLCCAFIACTSAYAEEALTVTRESTTQESSSKLLQNTPDPLLKPAVVSYEKGDYDRVLKKLHSVRKKLRRSELDDYFFLAGLSHLKLNSHKEAETALSRSLALKAKNSDALHALGLSLHQNGNTKAAQHALEEAIWFATYKVFSTGETWLALSVIYRSLEMPEKEQVALQNAMKDGKSIQNTDLRTRTALELADTYLKQGQTKEALQVLDNAKVDEEKNNKVQHLNLTGSALLLTPAQQPFNTDRAAKVSQNLSKLLADKEEVLPAPLEASSLLTLTALRLRLKKTSGAEDMLNRAASLGGDPTKINDLKRQLRLIR